VRAVECELPLTVLRCDVCLLGGWEMFCLFSTGRRCLRLLGSFCRPPS
jgi:hypothetical protein